MSANVNIFDFTPRFRIVEVGGMKIGITSVLGAEFAAQVNNPDVVITAAADALEEVVPELKDCDVRVLLAERNARRNGRPGQEVSPVRLRGAGCWSRRASGRGRKDSWHQIAVDRSRPQGHVRDRRRPVRRSEAADALPAGGAILTRGTKTRPR